MNPLDIIKNARILLVDTDETMYRWSNELLYRFFCECFETLKSKRADLFIDGSGKRLDFSLSDNFSFWTANELIEVYDVRFSLNGKYWIKAIQGGNTDSFEPDFSPLGIISDGEVNWTKIELPFIRKWISIIENYIIYKALDIDSTDQANEQRALKHKQFFEEGLLW